MAIPSFYHSTLTISDSLVALSAHESAHLSKSRRLKPGQAVKLLNGRGLVAQGIVESVEPRQPANVRCIDFEQHKRPEPTLTVATAIPKGDRQKVMIDMLTQLGVARIIPMVCERSVSKFNPSTHEKWQRIAIEASKQSQNPWLPEITDSASCIDIVGKNQHSSDTVMAYADGSGKNLFSIFDSTYDMLILIGPEGGFSVSEVDCFRGANVTAIGLGNNILRTELAAVAVASGFKIRAFGD